MTSTVKGTQVDRVAAAEAELARLRETLGAAEAALAAAEGGPSRAGAELVRLDELETDVVLGERDGAEVARLRDAAREELERSEGELRRARAVVVGLGPRVETAEQALKVARAEVALEQVEVLTPHLHAADRKLRDRFLAATAEAKKRKRILAEIDEAMANAAAACAEAGLAEPLPPDELDWRPDGIEVLVETVATLGWVPGRGNSPEQAIVPARPVMPRADADRAAASRQDADAREREKERLALVDEITRRSFHVGERAFEGEPVADVVRRLVEDDVQPAAVESTIAEVIAKRQAFIAERLAADEARVSRAMRRFPLEETEARWRIANEIPVDPDDLPSGFRLPGVRDVDLDDAVVPEPVYDTPAAA